MTCLYGSGVYLESTDACKVTNNRMSGGGGYSGSAYNNGNILYGIQIYDGTRNTASDNTIYGFGSGFHHRTNAISSGGSGFTISGNHMSHCGYGISMVNTGSGVISGNHIESCEHPMVTGQGGTLTRPVVITGNHAYGCTYRMEINGVVVVKSSGTATVGAGRTLTVLPISVNIPSGTVVTFAGTGVLTTTSSAAGVATSLTGTVSVHAIASGELATVTGIPHSTTSGNDHVAAYGNGDSVAVTY